MEPELKNYLEQINKNTERLAKRTRGFAGNLFEGILKGFGSIVGVIVGLLLVGVILNVLGVIPAFSKEVKQWRDLLEQAQTKQVAPVRNGQ